MSEWIYRIGLGQDEVSEEVLKASGLPYELVEVEEALRSHIDETLDKPYKYQTSMREDAPACFSCSSLISYLFVFAGISMPSLSMEKYEFAKKIEKNELRFGDIVFSRNGEIDDKLVNHCGLYLGDGKILQAAGYWYKGKVLIEDLDESPSFKNTVGYGRVVDNLKEKRYVVEIPGDRPDLRSHDALLNELKNHA